MASEIPCPSCGALIPPDAGACDLCGHTLAGSDKSATKNASSSPPDASDGSPPEEPVAKDAPPPAANGAAYCTECGTAFAPDDKFCSQCGTPRASSDPGTAAPPEGTQPVTADLPTGTASSESDAPSDPDEDAVDEAAINRKLMWLVGGAVVVVAALFLGTLFSERGGDPLARTAAERNAGDDIGTDQGETTPQGPFQGGAEQGGANQGNAPAQAAPVSVDALVERYNDDLSDDIAAQVDSIQGVLDGEDDDLMQQTLRQELINAYIGAGHLGRAAQEQKALAESSDDPDAWRRTGDLLYSWMEQLGQDGSNEAIAQVAPHVVEAYEAVLDQEPDNLDVRTDMATALLQTQSPMRGVEEINRVLEEDPEHFQARFNKGIMQLYIGRVDEAVAEFEEVKRIVGEDSPYYDRADRAIELAREEEDRAREEGGAPAEGMPAPEAGGTPDEAPATPDPNTP